MSVPVPRLLLVLLVTVLAARIAYADDPETRAAKRYFARGEKLFALGRFDEAIEQYQKAYDAKPLPDFLFNIGQCHRNLGDFEAAIFSFKKYLKLAPDAENRDQVEEYIAELEVEQERKNARKLRLDERTRDRPERPPPGEPPVYKKWWFWTGLAVVGAAGGVGIYAATRPEGPPDTNLGNIVFTK